MIDMKLSNSKLIDRGIRFVADELKISNKITLKTKKSPPAKAIGSVVPHPGATFPYSEFRGFKRFPKTVCFPLIAAIESYLLILFVLKKYVL